MKPNAPITYAVTTFQDLAQSRGCVHVVFKHDWRSSDLHVKDDRWHSHNIAKKLVHDTWHRCMQKRDCSMRIRVCSQVYTAGTEAWGLLMCSL